MIGMSSTISQDGAAEKIEPLICRPVVCNGLPIAGLVNWFGDATHKVIVGKSRDGMSFRGDAMHSGSVSCAGGLLAGLTSRI
jgi:hypothetical protein